MNKFIGIKKCINLYPWHNLLFILGTVYYVYIPYMLYQFFDNINLESFDFWFKTFSSQNEFYYFTIPYSILLIIFFIIGSSCAKKINYTVVIDLEFPKLFTKLFLFTSILIVLIFTYKLSNINIADYGENYDQRLVIGGPLAAFSSLIFIISLNAFRFNKNNWIKYGYLTLLFTLMALMLKIGTRIYAFNIIIGLTIFLFIKNNLSIKKNIIKITIFFIVLTMMMAAWGVLRSNSEVNLNSILFILFAEPNFTGIGLSSFLENNDISAFEVPFGFFGSVLNFIPSFIFPNKFDLLISSEINGYFWENPLGATHLYVDLLWNFGAIGGIIFITLMGIFYGLIRRSNNIWLYSYCCAFIPFTLFRNGFVTFNKDVFFIGIIIPFIINLVSKKSYFHKK